MAGATVNVGGVYVRDMRLTTFIKYQGNDLSSFVALQVAPERQVAKPAFDYYVLTNEHMMITGNTLRAEGGEGAQISFGLTTATGSADEYAVWGELPRETTQFADDQLELLPQLSVFLREAQALDTEKRFKDVVSTTSNHKGGSNVVTLSGTSKWSDYTNSTPVYDVATGRFAILSSVGKQPNVGWMSPGVWRYLEFHPQALTSIKYTGKDVVGMNDIQRLFGIPKILVADARYVSSVFNPAGSETLGFLWDDSFYMVYTDLTQNKFSIPFGWHASRPLAGYPNLREADESSFLTGPVIDRARRRYSHKFNQVSMAAGASYYLQNAV